MGRKWNAREEATENIKEEAVEVILVTKKKHKFWVVMGIFPGSCSCFNQIYYHSPNKTQKIRNSPRQYKQSKLKRVRHSNTLRYAYHH